VGRKRWNVERFILCAGGYNIMFKDKNLLKNDPEIQQLRKEYESLGILWLGYNIDEYIGLKDYKNKLRENLELLKKNPEQMKEQKKIVEDFWKKCNIK
jgi:hypothetical protein